MSTKNVVRITTEDTKKMYEFPSETSPEIWAVNIRIERLNLNGIVCFNAASYYSEKVIHVEERTLQNAGLIGRPSDKKDEPIEETPEDLILRLLEHVGVYPVE